MIHIIKWFVRFWNIFMIKFWSIETVLFDLQNLQRGLFLCWLNICNVCYCNSLIEQSNILFIIMFIYIFCHPTYSSFRPGSPPLSLSYGENYENLAPQINFPSRGLYFSMWYLYCKNINLRVINDLIWFDLIWFAYSYRTDDYLNKPVLRFTFFQQNFLFANNPANNKIPFLYVWQIRQTILNWTNRSANILN